MRVLVHHLVPVGLRAAGRQQGQQDAEGAAAEKLFSHPIVASSWRRAAMVAAPGAVRRPRPPLERFSALDLRPSEPPPVCTPERHETTRTKTTRAARQRGPKERNHAHARRTARLGPGPVHRLLPPLPRPRAGQGPRGLRQVRAGRPAARAQPEPGQHPGPPQQTCPTWGCGWGARPSSWRPAAGSPGPAWPSSSRRTRPAAMLGSPSSGSRTRTGNPWETYVFLDDAELLKEPDEACCVPTGQVTAVEAVGTCAPGARGTEATASDGRGCC